MKNNQLRQSSHFTIINLASRLFLPRNNPGITTVDLGHMGGSNHPKKLHVPPNLEHDQNRRPGFKSVHDVTKIAGLPQWHITIFFNFGIECEWGGKNRGKEREVEGYKGGP